VTASRGVWAGRSFAPALLALGAVVVCAACGAAQVAPASPDGETVVLEPKPAAVASGVVTPEAPKEAPKAQAAQPPPPAAQAAQASDEPPPKEVGARHVLIQFLGTERAPTSVVRTREQAEALAEKVLAKARRGESFTRLATEYSDEPGAAGRGGALGKFTRGKMAPAFEDAAFRLKVGQISEVVETPFGFHVILRTE
jgi:NIMA-interacting peptidyl-prolyl cis-trans isomerase 1